MEPLVINSPVGVASFPHIDKPDSYMGKEQYKCNLILDPSKADVAAFVEKVNSYVEKAKEEASAAYKEELAGIDENTTSPKLLKKRKTLLKAIEEIEDEYRHPIEDEYDRETEEPTGKVLIRAKSNASFKKGNETIEIQPKLYDSTGHAMSGPRPQVRGGSQLALGVKLMPYSAGFGSGVSVRLNAVQIVKLNSGVTSAGEASFGAVEGGYVAEKPAFSSVDSSEDSEY